MSKYIEVHHENGEMDPSLRSADIEAGMERGMRIHAALSGLREGQGTIFSGNLTEEESSAIDRFLNDKNVQDVIFRPGVLYTEQHLSDMRYFGIVDRLIISPELITLIEFKTGRVAHLTDKYQAQMNRYRNILQKIYAGRPIECYLLLIDEPCKVVKI